MNKEQASEAYIKGKLRDHQEYLGCEEHRRKQLITCDLYDLEQAFEDGWEESSKTMFDKACEWLEENIDAYSKVVIVENSIPTIVLTEDFKTNFKKAIKEQL